ncbi:TrmH family RNA methyltransferase [Sphingobacterium sp. LRF_L2]|uniref:TrmH family RNA methyltransferase n=1 Tax=Sphingobacterium sp. LRF_L2 TaxID=3369421 RepID=UPI003F621029
MLSKAQTSLITSLQHKKFRKQHGLFIVEGLKSVTEFISSDYRIHSIYCIMETQTKMGNLLQNIKCTTVSENEFQKITSLKNPQGILALVYLPQTEKIEWDLLRQQHALLLDDIQDPGNLGTIIRTAEWFGISHIVCSLDTVDAFNPKVVQATMGSLARVKLIYTDLPEFIQNAKMPTYGALLNGQSIYETDFKNASLIVMGNEGNGLSKTVIEKIDQAVTIPRIGAAESLNVAVATTIFCSELARQKLSIS